jgi:ribosomal protein S21
MTKPPDEALKALKKDLEELLKKDEGPVRATFETIRRKQVEDIEP